MQCYIDLPPFSIIQMIVVFNNLLHILYEEVKNKINSNQQRILNLQRNCERQPSPRGKESTINCNQTFVVHTKGK